MIQHAQLWLHRHYDQIKLTLLIVIGLMVFSFSTYMIGNQNRLINQVKNLSQQNRSLNLQSRNIARQNQVIAKQNRSYTRCIATIFAQYTHDFVPITINNLDTCTINSQSRATNNAPTADTPPQPSATTAQNQNSAPPTTTTPQGQSGGQSQPSQPEQLLNCTVDILGLHIGCN